MNRMIFIVIIMAVSLPVSASRSLSLSEALEIAKSSPRQQAIDETVEAAKGRSLQATGAFFPQFGVSERYLRTDDPVGVFAAKLQQGKFTAADFAVEKLNNPNALNQWITRLEIEQPVLHSVTDIYRKKASNEALASVRNIREYNSQNLRLQVTTLYYTAVAFAEKLKVLDEGISLMRSLESTYEQASAPTSANQTNYLVARSVRTDLEAQRVRVDTMSENTKRALLALLGLKDEDVVLTDPIPVSISSKGAGSKKRPDVLAAEDNYRAASLEHKAAKATFGPNLDAFAAYNRFTGDFESSKGSYEAGFMLSWPVFAGERIGKIKEASANRIIARKVLENTDMQARADLLNSEQRLAACMQQYELNRKAADQATQALRLAKERYQEGTLPLLDYSQTIQNWAMMQQRLIDSRYNMAESYSDRLFQTGDL